MHHRANFEETCCGVGGGGQSLNLKRNIFTILISIFYKEIGEKNPEMEKLGKNYDHQGSDSNTVYCEFMCFLLRLFTHSSKNRSLRGGGGGRG